jgi:hypothetical protein
MGAAQRSIKPLENLMTAQLAHNGETGNQSLSEEDKRLQVRKDELRRKAFADNTWAGYKSDLLSFIRYAGTDLPFPVTSTLIENYLHRKLPDN